MPMKDTCAVLLAGEDPGSGALCQVLFRPLIRWVWDNCRAAGIENIDVVAGGCPEDAGWGLPEGAPIVRPEAGEAFPAAFLTGLRDADALVIAGDAPFLFPDILAGALKLHRERGSDAAAIAAGEEPLACWVRGERLPALLEKAGALTAAGLWEAADPGKRELYTVPGTPAGLRGGGPRQQAKLTGAARELVFERLWDSGVEIPVTDGVVIDPRARIGAGTLILPGTVIQGETVVGEGSVIGPNSRLEDSTLGAECVIDSTYVLGSVLEEDVRLGPFVRVRPGSRLCAGVRIGNFVEVKNATVGPGTKSAHLTYIGDADVGARVNFGCGVCIANYDGIHKHRTTIGDDCFIGCNTNLVAPVALGDGAYTAAGTTVTEDVPEDALCIGRSRQVNLPGRAREHQKHPRK